MKNYLKYFAIGLVSLFLTSCATQTAAPTKSDGIPFVGQYTVNRFTLPNGLKVLMVEDHSSPTFAYQTWFNVGSRDEKVGKTGLAHLFEHMMFKETTTYKDGEFDRILEEAGTEGENAFTNRDYTAYIQELPKDKLELIVKMEADRMVNLVVNEHAYKTEIEVVQNERRFSYENNPDGLIHQALFETAFTDHSYHWPVIGYNEDLEKMTVQDAQEFYKSFYGPASATVVIVGDIKPKDAFKLIEKYYGPLARNTVKPNEAKVEPEQTSIRRKKLDLNIQIEKLEVAYHVPALTHPDAPVFEVIQGILTGGKSGRLKRALVDSGIATSIDSGSYQQPYPTLFVVGTTLQKGKRATLAEDIILKELTKLATTPVPAAELTKVKNLIRFNLIDDFGSNSSKARFLGMYETTTGAFEKGLEFHDKIQKVTPEEIQRVATTYFVPQKRTIIRGVPKAL